MVIYMPKRHFDGIGIFYVGKCKNAWIFFILGSILDFNVLLSSMDVEEFMCTTKPKIDPVFTEKIV